MAKGHWNVEVKVLVKVTTLTMQFILFKLIITVMVSVVSRCYATQLSGQTCFNNPNVNQRGQVTISSGRQVIVPRAKFNCSGRITNVAVSMQRLVAVIGNFPLFQVWHPTSLNSNTYNKIGEVRLPLGDFVAVGPGLNYHNTNLPLNGTSQIEFQSGDVIGYYQPFISLRLIWNIQTSGYTSFSNAVTSPSTSIDISTVENVSNNHQPLIAVMFDIRCNNLSIPTNGNTSCSSGRVGVGYEGDTCSFTCNTGYELTGSDTRTCKGDGSWNGTDNNCRRIPCPPLNNPNNGIINCSLGDDNFTSYGDICSFTCNTGYKLTGSDTRICQSDGSWSSNDSLLCKRVSCSSISDPSNGTISCSLGDDGVPSYEDTCRFTCNTGYELTGSDTRTCKSDGSWSGTENACGRVLCSLLSDSINGTINCSLEDDRIPSYEDTCSFTCNTGYELTGSDTRTCQSDGSWSNSDVMCTGIPTSSSTGSSTDIIGASMGGVVLVLVITTMLLCIVMLCVKRFYKEKASSERLSYNTSKLQKDIPIGQNPSYDVIEMANGGIKRGDTDILITTNPSYAAAAKPYSCKASDDECNYVQTNINEPDEYLDLEDTIKMDTNPSYGVTTGDRKTAFNSSDSMTHQPSHNTRTNEYDYANVHDDYLLHHSTAVNTGTSGGVKEESHYY